MNRFAIVLLCILIPSVLHGMEEGFVRLFFKTYGNSGKAYVRDGLMIDLYSNCSIANAIERFKLRYGIDNNNFAVKLPYNVTYNGDWSQPQYLQTPIWVHGNDNIPRIALPCGLLAITETQPIEIHFNQ